ncbi:MAG: NAD(P)/FAD-dependent oxidoreductase [Planctomycetaceae bacterium]|nr:NAD(P)/FAD-dependent oxidoreductase [Planctomycetaceae bacterium]
MLARPIVIVGAGMAGLCCVRQLLARGIDILVVDADHDVGGRVRTDVVDGFRPDRGLQDLQTAYPETQQVFDYLVLPRAKTDGERPFAVEVGNPYVVARAPVSGGIHERREEFRRGGILHEKLQRTLAAVALRVGLDLARSLHVRLVGEDEDAHRLGHVLGGDDCGHCDEEDCDDVFHGFHSDPILTLFVETGIPRQDVDLLVGKAAVGRVVFADNVHAGFPVDVGFHP